jgi:D-amino-acid dehydrogenase
LEAEGLTHRALSGAEVAALEPALALLARDLAGAIHYPGDETGNAHHFCTAMTEHARREGVEFRLATTVTSIEARAGRVTSLGADVSILSRTSMWLPQAATARLCSGLQA